MRLSIMQIQDTRLNIILEQIYDQKSLFYILSKEHFLRGSNLKFFW